MALKKRGSQLCNQLRTAIHLAFPELTPLLKDLTPPALRCLRANPTPQSVLSNGRRRFLEKGRPRRRCGQWRPEKFQSIYDLATASIGLNDPYRLDAFDIQALAHDLVDALGKQQRWLDNAIERLAQRSDFQLLTPLPSIGQPTAAAILTAIGNMSEYKNGKQLVKLAGLDIRRFESGARVRKLPKISHVGSAYLRYWLYHYALRLVAHDAHCTAYYARRTTPSPGQGTGPRALRAVCDTLIRMISRILTDHTTYAPHQEQHIARYYAAQRKAA